MLADHQIIRDFDAGHDDRRKARVIDLTPQDLGKMALNQLGDALGASAVVDGPGISSTPLSSSSWSSGGRRVSACSMPPRIPEPPEPNGTISVATSASTASFACSAARDTADSTSEQRAASPETIATPNVATCQRSRSPTSRSKPGSALALDP